MTVLEILKEVHEEKVELEVLQALQQWLLNDRSEWMSRAMESKSTIRAVKKIASQGSSPKGALKGIVSLCSEEDNDNQGINWVDIIIYRDSIVQSPFREEDDNLMILRAPEKYIRRYVAEVCEADYAEWMNSYTADDTMGLYEFMLTNKYEYELKGY